MGVSNNKGGPRIPEKPAGFARVKQSAGKQTVELSTLDDNTVGELFGTLNRVKRDSGIEYSGYHIMSDGRGEPSEGSKERPADAYE